MPNRLTRFIAFPGHVGLLRQGLHPVMLGSAPPLPGELQASVDCVAPSRSSLSDRTAVLLPFLAFVPYMFAGASLLS